MLESATVYELKIRNAEITMPMQHIARNGQPLAIVKGLALKIWTSG